MLIFSNRNTVILFISLNKTQENPPYDERKAGFGKNDVDFYYLSQ